MYSHVSSCDALCLEYVVHSIVPSFVRCYANECLCLAFVLGGKSFQLYSN